MFKYFYHSPKEESVYKLVAEQVNGESKFSKKDEKFDSNARYRSKHSNMVREEADKKKAWPAKTMGVPRLPVEEPEFFLRKHSKRPFSVRPKSVAGNIMLPREKGCQTEEDPGKKDVIESVAENAVAETGEEPQENNSISTSIQTLVNNAKTRPKSCYQRLCFNTVKKPSIPDPKLGVNIIIQDAKDFVHSNALTAIGARPDKPKDPILYVDTPKGDTREWLNSGLAPRYIHQKKFANVPVYITLRKKEFLEQLKKKQEEEQEKASNSQVRILDIDERDKVIEGLKQNWNQIFSNYQRLPLLIDTPGKIKRKTGMEAQLKKLEIDIQMLQRHDSIYVSDIAPCSFYAFSTGDQKQQKGDKRCK